MPVAFAVSGGQWSAVCTGVWKRVRCIRGGGTSAASRAIRSGGSWTTCEVPSRALPRSIARSRSCQRCPGCAGQPLDICVDTPALRRQAAGETCAASGLSIRVQAPTNRDARQCSRRRDQKRHRIPADTSETFPYMCRALAVPMSLPASRDRLQSRLTSTRSVTPAPTPAPSSTPLRLWESDG